jgi:hypothetical protein
LPKALSFFQTQTHYDLLSHEDESESFCKSLFGLEENKGNLLD